ncbi:MAG: 3'(2'),5'-bisphosphate nucleotidase CysQ [Acidobacteriota bacterium]
MGGYGEELARIEAALAKARELLARFTPGAVDAQKKSGGDPVTEADTAVDALLKEMLPQNGEGWLSEETLDDPARLSARRVWVVDPLDGTKEFVQGLPEWSVSVGLVEDGRPVAGGILNPATDQLILGALGHGVKLNGQPVGLSPRTELAGAVVLASRSEVGRGQWEAFRDSGLEIRPIGSVAYKLGLVAAGLADATWTLVPKHEWDVAAGVALILAAGGVIVGGSPEEERFNRPHPLLTRLLAASPALMPQIQAEIARRAA